MFDFTVHPKDQNSTSGFMYFDGLRFYYSFYCENTVQAVSVQAELVTDNITQYSNAITVPNQSVYYQGSY